MTVDDLVNFWSRLDLRKAPFAHPDDLPVLRSTKKGQLIDEDSKKTYSSEKFAFADQQAIASQSYCNLCGNCQPT